MKKTINKPVRLAIGAVLGLSILAGCGSIGGKKAATTQSSKLAPSMGVNTYLWRASLETLDFMPLESVDPFGGVIITDWYANPKAPEERFKANVYILDTNLRADALKTAIFKQVRSGSSWADAPMDADTGRLIENAILTRARELYIATVDAR